MAATLPIIATNRPSFIPLLVVGSLLAAAGCDAVPPRQPASGPATSTAAPEPTATPGKAAPPDADQANGDGTPAGPARLEVPPLPDGTPEELLKFVADLKTAKVAPKTQAEFLTYVTTMCARCLEAADRILAREPADAPVALEAVRLKLDTLLTLADFDAGGKAHEDAEAYARSLAAATTPARTRIGRRALILMDAQKAFNAREFTAIPGIVASTADLLAADPDDIESVKLAASLARATERIAVNDGPSPAVAAYETFGRLLEKSTVPDIQKMASGMAGAARRLALPGKPMQIEGTKLDGTAFDPASLKGKVVLVDFWATWCGPCLEEIPNIRANYARYHDRGFEVLAISLDDNREDLDAFLAEQKLPWPILFSGQGWNDPVARFYGVNGIPQLMVIGRDGNVVSLEARGEKLGELLAGLLPEDPAAGPPADSKTAPAADATP